MSNLSASQLHWNMQRAAARMFILNKGRLPLDRVELECWLLEFSDCVADMLSRVLDNFEDHMRVCNHPLPLSKINERSEP